MSKIVAVQDHALIRYLERVKGFDFTPIRDEIAALVQSAVNLGSPFYALNGHTFVLKGAAVVTVVTSRSGAALRKSTSKRNGRSQRVQR